MNIGMIGLGKLGLPVAVAMSMKGHDVMGFDVTAQRMSKQAQPYLETGPNGKDAFNPWLERSTVRFGSMQQVVDHAEILFVAVQTPHHPRYEGVTTIPNTRSDFDYKYLVSAIKDITPLVKKPTLVVVISTCLPGTIDRFVVPVVRNNANVVLVYNPFFIAMGTTMRDFLNPEFVLLGFDKIATQKEIEKVILFYSTVCTASCRVMSIRSAELTKVSYNTFISMKIAFVNTLMEICYKTGADVDSVTNALKCATTRLISPAYLSGGMGDGGGCHPRDNIAMSWLAEKYDLSFDLFDSIMRCREEQCRWLADLMIQSRMSGFVSKLAILGYAFKPETNITTGSPALLVSNMLKYEQEDHMLLDPQVDDKATYEKQVKALASEQHIVLVGCKHECFRDIRFAPGSVVFDPHRYIPEQTGVEVIRIGENHELV